MCTSSRFFGARIAVGSAVEAGEPIGQAAELNVQLAPYLGPLYRRITDRDEHLTR